MKCEEIRAMYLAAESEELTAAHMSECAACRAVRNDLDVGRLNLSEPMIWEEPPPELENQVVALISGNQTPASGAPRRQQRWIRPVAAAAVFIAAVGLVAVLRAPSPDWTVAMPGTDLAPGASSTVVGWNTDTGTRMLLTVDGLERAPEGYVYEFWLSGGPLHISAGTFTASGEIELWSGVSRGDFPRLWVTLEPLDEDESPSGHTVLDTEV